MCDVYTVWPQVLTNVNKFVVILFGVAALHDPLSPLSAAGMLLAMGGGLWYGRARSRAAEFAAPSGGGRDDHKADGGTPLRESESLIGSARADVEAGGGGLQGERGGFARRC